MKYIVIVNVNLEYNFDAKNPDEAIEMAENVELPKEYVEDSFDIVKVVDKDENIINQFQKKMKEREIYKLRKCKKFQQTGVIELLKRKYFWKIKISWWDIVREFLKLNWY